MQHELKFHLSFSGYHHVRVQHPLFQVQVRLPLQCFTVPQTYSYFCGKLQACRREGGQA